ncbi:MAG: general secretion pathway protein GspK [Alphaproteobacteria bacterium]
MTPRIPPADDERGFALVIVLWLFVTLFALGAEFSQEMRQDAVATANFADETQSYYLASAAANLTFFRLLEQHKKQAMGQEPGQGPEGLKDGEPEAPLVSTDGVWHWIDLWGAPVAVRVSDEGGKVAINWVGTPVLVHVLTNLGVGPDRAAEIADAILDWRDKDEEKRMNGAENEYYSSLPRPYVAKNAPFDSIEELLMVKGVTPDLFYGDTDDFPIGLREVFTVFHPPGEKLNVQYLTPEVLRAYFGLDKEELQQLMDTRERGQATDLLGVLKAKVPDPRIAEKLSAELAPTLLSVEVQAKLPSSRISSHIGAIIDLGESSEGVYVQRWLDQMAPAEVS